MQTHEALDFLGYTKMRIVRFLYAFSYWSMNGASPVYKLYTAFQTRSKTRTLLLLDKIVICA